MTLSVIWLLILLSCVYKTSGVVKWEFGKDTNGTFLLEHRSGFINLCQKRIVVTLMVPKCAKLVYVKVEVYNWLSTPDVEFTWATNAVVITYTLFQSSTSQYEIIGKALQVKSCDKKNNYEEYESDAYLRKINTNYTTIKI